MKTVYQYHSIVPSFFTTPEKALAYAWACSAPSAICCEPIAKAAFIKEGKRQLKTTDTIRSPWDQTKLVTKHNVA